MTQMTSRDKKLVIVGVVFVTCYALFVFVARPIYDKQKTVHQQIQDKILFIQKYQEIVKQKSYYEAKSIENKSIHTALSQKFLNETNPALATASQQSLLEELARQTGVNIVRVRIDKPKYMEKLLTITTQITMRSTLRNLTRFVHMLESNQKFLIIEEVSAQRTNDTDLEELQSQLTISGFIKIMEEKKAKAI